MRVVASPLISLLGGVWRCRPSLSCLRTLLADCVCLDMLLLDPACSIQPQGASGIGANAFLPLLPTCIETFLTNFSHATLAEFYRLQSSEVAVASDHLLPSKHSKRSSQQSSTTHSLQCWLNVLIGGICVGAVLPPPEETTMTSMTSA